MADWQMSSWQPVRPAEPGEDAAAEVTADESSPWQRRAESGKSGRAGSTESPTAQASAPERKAVPATKVVPESKPVPESKAEQEPKAAAEAPKAAGESKGSAGGPKAGATPEESAPVTKAAPEPRASRRRADTSVEEKSQPHVDDKRRADTPPTTGFRSTPVLHMPSDGSGDGSVPASRDPNAPPLHGSNHQKQDLQGQLPPVASASALDLTNALLVKHVVPAPAYGWRRWLYEVTGRRVNLGNSAKEERLVRLTRQVDRHLVGCYRVSVLSLKGGVGKTTTTATLGSTFAQIRGDRVIAVDANPDRGTLSQKVPLETPATVRNLLRDIDDLDRYSDVRAYTSQNAFRLEVLASDSDPAVSEAFSGQDYDKTVELLEKFYSVVLTDCGTGLMHSAMTSILAGSDALVVVSSSAVDGARSASATLDWLDAHGHSELVRSSVAVVNAVRPRAGKVDLAKVVEHFEQRCRAVVLVPFDPHLEEGAEIDLSRLKRRTRIALLELAAAVAAGFPSNRPEDVRRVSDPGSS